MPAAGDCDIVVVVKERTYDDDMVKMPLCCMNFGVEYHQISLENKGVHKLEYS